MLFVYLIFMILFKLKLIVDKKKKNILKKEVANDQIKQKQVFFNNEVFFFVSLSLIL